MSDWAAPRRVRLVALVLVLGAVGFAVTGVVRMFVDASPGGKADMVTLPLALLVADLIIAGALVTGWYSVRPVAQGLAIFGALVHVLVLLRSGGWWIRGWSALLSVAHVYALLLFFAFTAEERDDELDELEDEDELDGERSRPTASAGVLVPAQAGPPEIPPAEPVETPVEQLVDAPDPARAEGSAGPEPAGEAPAGTPTADESAPVPDSADEWPAEKAASEEKAVGEEKARNPGPTVEDANTDDSTEATPGDGTGSAERVEVAAGRRGGSDRSDEDTTEGTA